MRLLGPMIDFPALTSRTLSNDLRLVVCPTQSSRVHAALVIRSGSAADAAGHEGLAHLAEHTSVAEARGFPGHGLWQHLRFEGGEINAQTSVDATTFLVRLPAPSWPKALAALAAIARSGAPSGGAAQLSPYSEEEPAWMKALMPPPSAASRTLSRPSRFVS